MRTEDRHERMTTAERRQQIIVAAIREFALHGYFGGSTEAIARQAAITHPYIFKLFGTKRDLFCETVDRVFDVLIAVFAAAPVQHADSFDDLRQAYKAMLTYREQVQLLLQGFAATSVPEIRDLMARRYAELAATIRDHTGASDEDIFVFLSCGFLLTIESLLGLPPR